MERLWVSGGAGGGPGAAGGKGSKGFRGVVVLGGGLCCGLGPGKILEGPRSGVAGQSNTPSKFIKENG